MRQHVGVGVALEPALVLDLHAADHQPPARDQAMAVISDPGGQARSDQQQLSEPQIGGRRDLQIVGSTGYHAHHPAGLLDQPRVVGRARELLIPADSARSSASRRNTCGV